MWFFSYDSLLPFLHNLYSTTSRHVATTNSWNRRRRQLLPWPPPPATPPPTMLPKWRPTRRRSGVPSATSGYVPANYHSFQYHWVCWCWVQSDNHALIRLLPATTFTCTGTHMYMFILTLVLSSPSIVVYFYHLCPISDWFFGPPIFSHFLNGFVTIYDISRNSFPTSCVPCVCTVWELVVSWIPGISPLSLITLSPCPTPLLLPPPQIISEVYLLSHLRGRKHQEVLATLNPSSEGASIEVSEPVIVEASEEHQGPPCERPEVLDRIKAGKKRAKKLRHRMASRVKEQEGRAMQQTTSPTVQAKHRARYWEASTSLCVLDGMSLLLRM